MKKFQQWILGMQFLTRIPITKKSVPAEPTDFKGAMTFFCLIGLIVGVFQYFLFELGALIDPLLGALVATLGGIWITGGIHLDGLSDVFDGFGANKDTELTLQIMKDSRVGTFGVVALIIDFAYHMVGFYLLKEHPLYMIWVPTAGKMAICMLCSIGKNVKHKGMGALWIENISKGGLLVNLIVCTGVGISILYWEYAIMGVGLIFGTVILLNKKFTRKLEGLNGDCLGATQQLMEWVMLTYLIIVATVA